MKRGSILGLAALLCLLVAPTAAFANSPVPPPADCGYLVDCYDAPEEAAYLDLLIPLAEDSPYYVACGPLITEEFRQSPDCGMVTLSVGGCISYSAHMRDAEPSAAAFAESGWRVMFSSTAEEQIRAAGADGTLRVALFDADGRMLHVSNPLTEPETSRYKFASRGFRYDISTGELTQDTTSGDFLFAGHALLFGAMALLTSGTEMLIAMAFRLRKVKTVGAVNLFSNYLMNMVLLAMMVLTALPYALIVTILEVFVCAGEFLYYRFKAFPEEQPRRLLLFTATANAVSLLIGLALQFTGCF